MPDENPLRNALSCKCPRCGQGDLFPSRFSLTLKDRCDSCGLDISKNDAADGPAVFLIFILGSTVVPLALWLELALEPPFWAHIVLWTPMVIGLTIAFLRPVKSYVLALQLKHQAGGDMEQ